MSPYKYEGDAEKQDLIVKTKQSTTHTCASPRCQFCVLANGHQLYPSGTHTYCDPESEGVMKLGDLKPDNTMWTDQYKSQHCGHLPHTRGKEAKSSKFCGGTIIANHASSFLFHQNQVSLNSNNTLNTKNAFERFANDFNICIKHYRCDNGIFKSTAFANNCAIKSQRQSFCGIDAHHQNGAAKHAIKMITTWSRAMLIHVMLCWPEQMTKDLWPLEFDYAVFLHNHLPKRSHRLAPIELFTQTTIPHSFFKGAHIWGCPVYVFQPTLRKGKKIPRWDLQRTHGQFLGFPAVHSAQVALVCHIHTNSATP
eukprot:9202816-Ditylum_brightwellii.AAC.1